MVYGLGFTLDKLASTLEHGWRVYSANVRCLFSLYDLLTSRAQLWNGLDAALVGNFMTYAILRFIGIAHVASGEVVNSANYWAVDILSLGALLLFPRLAFTFLSDNVFFLALRAMLSQFVYLMLLASWCFLCVCNVGLTGYEGPRCAQRLPLRSLADGGAFRHGLFAWLHRQAHDCALALPLKLMS